MTTLFKLRVVTIASRTNHFQTQQHARHTRLNGQDEMWTLWWPLLHPTREDSCRWWLCFVGSPFVVCNSCDEWQPKLSLVKIKVWNIWEIHLGTYQKYFRMSSRPKNSACAWFSGWRLPCKRLLLLFRLFGTWGSHSHSTSVDKYKLSMPMMIPRPRP